VEGYYTEHTNITAAGVSRFPHPVPYDGPVFSGPAFSVAYQKVRNLIIGAYLGAKGHPQFNRLRIISYQAKRHKTGKRFFRSIPNQKSCPNATDRPK